MKKYISFLACTLLTIVGMHSFALDTLSGTGWDLTTYNAESASGTLLFDDDHVYSKFCNNVSQKYTYDGMTIVSDGMGISTDMYCEGLPMTLETNFDIDTAANVTLSGDTLTVKTAANNTYIFTKSLPPIIGGDRDEHGCIGSAGYNWDTDLMECVRPWEIEGVRAAFNFAVENKFTSKNTLKEFNRNDTITRQEAAIMLVLLGKNVYDTNMSLVTECRKYLDDKSIGEGFKKNVYEACAMGLMVGSSGNFMPSGSLTRGQALSILVKMVNGQADTPTTPFWDAYVENAKETKLLTLEGEQNFEAAITRGEFIEWIHTIHENQKHTLDMQNAQKSLDAAKQLWSKNKPQTYIMTQTISCFCAPDYTKPRTYTVKDGVVVPDPTDTSEFKPDLLTVEGSFAVIQDALDKKAARLTVEYDATLGYPKLVSIDYNEMIADEEKYYTFVLTK